MQYTVLNIETAANPAYKGPQLAKRGEEKPGLSPITGRIVAVGLMDKEQSVTLVALDPNREREIVGKAIEALHLPGDFNNPRTTIVTFNGKLFDLPFLAVRACVHEIKHNFAPWLERYTNFHLDVYDILNCRRTPAKGSLKHWCHTFGVTMQEGDGEDMQTWVDEGNLDAIIAHNQSTLKATDEIFRKIAFPLAGISLTPKGPGLSL